MLHCASANANFGWFGRSIGLTISHRFKLSFDKMDLSVLISAVKRNAKTLQLIETQPLLRGKVLEVKDIKSESEARTK